MMDLPRKRSASIASAAPHDEDKQLQESPLPADHLAKRLRLAQGNYQPASLWSASSSSTASHQEPSSSLGVIPGGHPNPFMDYHSLYSARSLMGIHHAAARMRAGLSPAMMTPAYWALQQEREAAAASFGGLGLYPPPMSSVAAAMMGMHGGGYSTIPMMHMPDPSFLGGSVTASAAVARSSIPAAAAAGLTEPENKSGAKLGASRAKDPPSSEPGSPRSRRGEGPLERLSDYASYMPSIPIATNNTAAAAAAGGGSDRDALTKIQKRQDTTQKNGAGKGRKSAAGKNLCCAPVSPRGKDAPSGKSPVARDKSDSNSNTKSLTGVVLLDLAQRPLPKPDEIDRKTGDSRHWTLRPHTPLAIDEDCNWLSEFQQFLREEILEVFVASGRDVEARTAAKKIATTQVGIRCRFCAHLHTTERASRASAFPSSVRQIYQSFTMMLREHLNGQCQAMPASVKMQFARLKGQSAQSASDSKRYWIYAAQKLGMIDTEESGIQVTAESQAHGLTLPPFGSSPELEADLQKACAMDNNEDAVVLAGPADKLVSSDFTYAVVNEAVLVHLAESEKIGNRSCLTVGLPGLACRHCCKAGRSGLSRVFPARKRNLKVKVQDLADHLRRCTLCPKAVQEHLQRLQAEQSATSSGNKNGKSGAAIVDRKSKFFYARLWRRLGHSDDDATPGPLESQDSS